MMLRIWGYMINSVRFTAVLDTNVLYPVIIRDVLFWFAFYDMYTPAWSNHIFEEWESVCKRKFPSMSQEEILRRLKKADEAFPFARVENYEPLMKSLTLKDPKDNHVLAAAIKINANVIVTQNVRDFPEEYLMKFNIGVKSADDFICDIFDLDPETAIQAFMDMVFSKKKPPMDEFQILDSMRKVGLEQSANFLHSKI